MESKPPAVTCSSCAREWHSISMAEGLRLLGACPRCNGGLTFAGDGTEASPAAQFAAEGGAAVAPHLVLGIPRR